MIEVKSLSKKFKIQVILNEINYTFQDTGFFGLVGESGVGKTTFLNLIGLLDHDYFGKIYYDGQIISSYSEKRLFLNKNISIFNQEILLIENLTVYENLSLFCNKKKEIVNLLQQFGLIDYINKKVSELSQGEKKRCVFIRTILKPAKIYLFDEPTSFLDEENSEKVLKKIKELSKTSMVLVISHDQKILEKYVDVLLCLKKAQIVEIFSNEFVSSGVKDRDFKENRLSLKSTFLLVKDHLKSLKIKSGVSVFLLTLIFFLTFFSFALKDIDINKIHYDSLVHEKSDELELIVSDVEGISENEMQFLEDHYQISLGKKYHQGEDLLYLTYQDMMLTNQVPAYYYNIVLSQEVYSIENWETVDLLMGRVPTNSNEIVISEFVANMILKKGVLTSDQTYFMPNSLDELLNSHKEVLFGEVPLVIVGIEKDSYPIPEFLLEKNYDALNDEEIRLLNDYSARNFKTNHIYVLPSFENYLLSFEKVEVSLDNIFVKVRNNQELWEIIERYSKPSSHLDILDIVSQRIDIYKGLLEFLKMLGLVVLLFVIVFYFLNLLYLTKNSIVNHSEEICLLKENGFSLGNILVVFWFEILFYIILAMFFGWLFYMGSELFINRFVSQYLCIYFHALHLSFFVLLRLIFFFFLSYFGVLAFSKEIKKKKLVRIEE